MHAPAKAVVAVSSDMLRTRLMREKLGGLLVEVPQPGRPRAAADAVYWLERLDLSAITEELTNLEKVGWDDLHDIGLTELVPQAPQAATPWISSSARDLQSHP